MKITPLLCTACLIAGTGLDTLLSCCEFDNILISTACADVNHIINARHGVQIGVCVMSACLHDAYDQNDCVGDVLHWAKEMGETYRF